MAISKVVLNGTTLMDATTATATAEDIIAPKTAMLADGIMTTGTGVGGDICDSGWPTGAVISNVVSVRDSALYGRIGIQSIELPECLSLGASSFFGCTSLVSFKAPKAAIGQYSARCFQGCTSLEVISLPSQKAMYGWTFLNCSALRAVDLGELCTDVNGTETFKNDVVLNVIILRHKDGITSLSGIGGFDNTPFASGGSGGTLYVPQALISSYQNATNWSTILGYTNNQILPIEGSIYETQYADGTPIT